MDLETFVSSLNDEQVESLYKILPDPADNSHVAVMFFVSDLVDNLEFLMDCRGIDYEYQE